MVTILVKRNVKLLVNKAVLLHAVQITLNLYGKVENTDLGIVVGNDEFLRKLNQKYRQVDEPTDVLSFPAGEEDPDTADLYLGDVVISLPRAQEQAAAGGHSLEAELQLLVVHGTLHLLGYDHAEAIEKDVMQTSQDKILEQLGIQSIGKL